MCTTKKSRWITILVILEIAQSRKSYSFEIELAI
jgi:hypothetical protein